MTTFFEHQRTRYKRSYLKTLIHLASADGQLEDHERELIQKIGIKRGLKIWQIESLLREGPTLEDVFIPESLHNRMNLIYDLMQVIYADGYVSDKEVKFITDIIKAFNLPSARVDQLITLFEGQTPSAAEWNEFIESVIQEPQPVAFTIL